MATELAYEKVMEQAQELPLKDQLRLIRDLATTLTQRLPNAEARPKVSADFYGVIPEARFEAADFAAVEWRPSSEDLCAR
ncbi:MAG: hypothetical protein HYR55_02670 [Acidobacteria bacterium]|nr:hypothetical protein [Acidobacteriota bacterium]MBI3656078.1 hypothetical protein [Acidobacteriota bacterium]